jgi:hypothetical protein
VDQRWPNIRIWLDGQLILNQSVQNGQLEFDYKGRVDMQKDQVVLEIEYYGKTDNDTCVNDHGQIVQNQSVTIENLLINNVDVVENRIIYLLGNYTAELSTEKLAYYIKHGYHVGPSHSLAMHENGRWRLAIKLPILTNFIRMVSPQEAHEKWPDPELLNNIITTASNIRKLEQQIKRKS